MIDRSTFDDWMMTYVDGKFENPPNVGFLGRKCDFCGNSDRLTSTNDTFNLTICSECLAISTNHKHPKHKEMVEMVNQKIKEKPKENEGLIYKGR